LADERAAGYLQVDQLNRTLNKIPWVRLEGEDMYMYEPSEKFRDLVERHRKACKSLTPLLNSFEPQVSVRMAALEEPGAILDLDFLRDPQNIRAILVESGWQHRLPATSISMKKLGLLSLWR
jgi:hypothetical protein